MIKFCLINRFGIPYAYYECMCADCDWMGEFCHLKSDNWDHYRYCPKCGSDNIDEFDDGIYEEYIHMPTEWGSHRYDKHGVPIKDIDSIPKLIWKLIWRKIRRHK